MLKFKASIFNEIENGVSMQDWWKSLTPKQQIASIVAIIGAIGGISVAPSITIDTGKNTTTTITNNGDQHSGTGDNVAGDKIINVKIGLTLEEHEQRLKSRESEIREEFKKSHIQDPQLLAIELSTIQKALQNSKSSYEALVRSLKDRIVQLEAQRGDWPDDVLDKAIEALKKGDLQTADDLFKQVEVNSEKHIKRAAEAAYQRGKIAEYRIRYADSLNQYENAVRLQPDNWLYLNNAGLMHQTLANYKKAIEYFALALAINLKIYDEDHPSIAIYRNNLGLAWNSLGEFHKAIEYFKLALASDLKTYDEDHPQVAISRNNLGLAWYSLGEYLKAIQYFDKEL